MLFGSMPLIPFPNKDGSTSNVKDIIRRVIFSDESYLKVSNYNYYTVKDTDTPDSLSQKFYDTPNYHWIIILYNNAFDPFYTFPLSQQNLDEFINKKYEGQSLFISPTDSTEPFFNTTLNWEPADVITGAFFDDQGAEQFKNEELFARVKVVDNLNSRLQLDKAYGNFKVGDRIARRKDIVDTLRATVRRAVNGRNAMHHFENEGQVLNALATPPDSNDVQYPLNSSNANGSTVQWSDTLLYNYIYNESSTFVVSNEQYEEKVNNNKRQIRIPDSRVVDEIFKEYKDIVRS